MKSAFHKFFIPFNTIFFRLLLSFFAIMILTGCVGIFITSAFHHISFERLQKDYSRERIDAIRDMTTLSGETAQQLFNKTDIQAFKAFKQRLNKTMNMDIFLLRRDGSSITEDSVPEECLPAIAQARETGKESILQYNEDVIIVQILHSAEKKPLLVLTIQRPIGNLHKQKLSDRIPPPPPQEGPFSEFRLIGFPFFPFENGYDIFRGIILFFLVATFCFLLTRTLTKPIRNMQHISKKIAGGDYTARIGTTLTSAGHELQELGRDFDNMAEKTERVIKGQRRLLRDISHELRSPLARMNVALELSRKHLQSDQGSKTLNRIELESNRLNDLIEELLALTRQNESEQHEKQEILDLQNILENITEDVRYEYKNRSKQIFLDGLRNCAFQGNRRLLHRAFENILRNAMKYTARGSAVKVSLATDDESITAIVLDNGPGVPEEDLQQIFEPFYRVSEARERERGEAGAGLGLAIARQAILLHNGTIEASNRRDTTGLKVKIRLPKA